MFNKTSKIEVHGTELLIWNSPVGIMCSGGIDSSLLLYLLLKNSKHLVKVYTLVTNDKDRRSSITSTNVLEVCMQLTGNTNVEHIKIFEQSQNFKTLYDIPRKDILTRKIKTLYSGLTKNPPDAVIDNFINCETPHRNERNPNVERSTLTKFGKFYAPFTNLNKKDIATLYQKLNLMENLFPVTSSCEGIQTDIFNQVHCGSCWWCNERKWGFDKL